jgi:hypothetical protein
MLNTPDFDMAEVENNMKRFSHNNPNRFSAWYPQVKNICNTPETEIIPVSSQLVVSIIDDKLDDAVDELNQIAEKIFDFAQIHGYPVFIKNGLFSSKHSWDNTCCITEDCDPLMHIARIIYDWETIGRSPSFEIIVRKMIQTTPAFHAFDGNMPVTREFRFFSDGESITGYQPYWPLNAIEGHPVDCEQWKERLCAISLLTVEEQATLVGKASIIGAVLAGEWDNDIPVKSDRWSIDFLQDKDGKWWMIDVAQAHESYCSTPDQGFISLCEK